MSLDTKIRFNPDAFGQVTPSEKGGPSFLYVEGFFIPRDGDKVKAAAKLFCEMDSEEQAAFFANVAEISKSWDMAAVFQWRHMQQFLTPDARQLIVDLKEHTE